MKSENKNEQTIKELKNTIKELQKGNFRGNVIIQTLTNDDLKTYIDFHHMSSESIFILIRNILKNYEGAIANFEQKQNQEIQTMTG